MGRRPAVRLLLLRRNFELTHRHLMWIGETQLLAAQRSSTNVHASKRGQQRAVAPSNDRYRVTSGYGGFWPRLCKNVKYA
jgi:hypothetical protein